MSPERDWTLGVRIAGVLLAFGPPLAIFLFAFSYAQNWLIRLSLLGMFLLHLLVLDGAIKSMAEQAVMRRNAILVGIMEAFALAEFGDAPDDEQRRFLRFLDNVIAYANRQSEPDDEN